MYGHTPQLPIKLRPEVVSTLTDAVDGLATRTIVKLHPFDGPKASHIELMYYIPNKKIRPVPMLLGSRSAASAVGSRIQSGWQILWSRLPCGIARSRRQNRFV